MAGAGLNAEERERKKKLDQEAKRDVMLMGIATVCIMASIGGLMVSIPCLLSSTFLPSIRTPANSQSFSLHGCLVLASTWLGSQSAMVP